MLNIHLLECPLILISFGIVAWISGSIIFLSSASILIPSLKVITHLYLIILALFVLMFIIVLIYIIYVQCISELLGPWSIWLLSTAPLVLDVHFIALLNPCKYFSALTSYLLHLTWVEISIDLKRLWGKGFLKGIFKNQGCQGLLRQLLAMNSCIGSSRRRFTGSTHSRVSWRLREIQETRENQVDSS